MGHAFLMEDAFKKMENMGRVIEVINIIAPKSFHKKAELFINSGTMTDGMMTFPFAGRSLVCWRCFSLFPVTLLWMCCPS